MPQFLLETFTGTTGTNLETYNPNWIRASGGGAAQISNNRLRHAAGAGTASYRRNDAIPPSPDYSVSADFYVNSSNTGISAGVSGRYLSTETTFYHARILTGTGIQLVRYTLNGSATTMATYPYTTSVGSVFNLRLEMIGTLISAYLDEVQVLSVTNNNNTQTGYVGVRFNSAGGDLVQIDNLIAGTPGADNQPGNAAVDGVSSNPVAGMVSGSGAGSVGLSGVLANPSVGNLSVTGASSAITMGVAGSPSASSVSASGASSAQSVGVGAMPGVGMPLASGGSIGVVIGVSANPEAGSITAGSGGAATIGGVFAKFSAADLIASGASNAIIIGGSANPATGLVTAEIEEGQEDDIDASLVPPRQTVVFEGSIRVVAFEGSNRVVSFEGSKRLVEFQ